MPNSPISMLCLFSSPLLAPNQTPLDMLALEKEQDKLRVVLDQTRLSRLKFAFATTDELLNGITEGFDIFHLSGHGNPDFLLFEDQRGGSQAHNRDYLREVFSQS